MSVLAGGFLARGAVVRSVDIEGGSAFPRGEVISWLLCTPGQPFSDSGLSGDLRRIADRYHASGYWTATAHVSRLTFSPDSGQVDVTINVDEGRRTVLARVVWNGLTTFSADQRKEFLEASPGSPANAGAIEADISRLLSLYERRGFPFARCTIESLVVASGTEVDSLVVVASVEEGNRVTIDEIRVTGNKETNAVVVARESRFSVGEPYDADRVSTIRPRLERLNIFSRIDDPVLYLRGRSGGLLIRVEEGKTSTFDGIIGYLPGANGAEGVVTGLVSVSMRNLFGTGRKLAVRWQREDRASQELGFRYVEPWVFGLPANIGGGFLQRQQDSSYVRRAVDVKIEIMASRELSLNGVLASENVIPSDDTLRMAIPRTSTTSAGTEIDYDTRNEAISPTGGVRYRADYQYGRKRGPGGSSSTLQRFGMDLQVFAELVSRHVLAIALHGRQVKGGALDESDLYRFGGTATLRGYRENQFLGSALAWSNLEYRLLLGRRSYLFGFVDAGYYSRPEGLRPGLPGVESWKTGFGAGVRLDTALGNIGVSLAFGQGDTFGTAKIHLGLLNEF